MSAADAPRRNASEDRALLRPGSPIWHRDSPIAWLQGYPGATPVPPGGLAGFAGPAGSCDGPVPRGAPRSTTAWSGHTGIAAAPRFGLAPSQARTRKQTRTTFRDGFGAGAGASSRTDRAGRR